MTSEELRRLRSDPTAMFSADIGRLLELRTDYEGAKMDTKRDNKRPSIVDDFTIHDLAFQIIDGQRLDIPYDFAAECLARAIYNGRSDSGVILIRRDVNGYWPQRVRTVLDSFDLAIPNTLPNGVIDGFVHLTELDQDTIFDALADV